MTPRQTETARTRNDIPWRGAVAALLFGFVTIGHEGNVRGAEQDLVAAGPGPVELEELPVRVALAPRDGESLATQLDRLRAGARAYLLLRDVRASAPPGVLYHLYLGLGDDEEPVPDDPRLVGNVSFYGMVTDGGQPIVDPDAVSLSFDVSALVAGLVEQGATSDASVLTILSSQPAVEGARPVIGRIELVLK